MKKIAIIGSGISGLTCGYRLNKNHDITLFEKNNYIGGHTHTVEIDNQGEQARIDTGFIVFNDRTYPNFISMMKEIGVSFEPTEMSFSVRNDFLGLEYNGNSIDTLFAQRHNLVKLQFWKMLVDIVHFNQAVKHTARSGNSITIGQYLEQANYSKIFEENYLLPMISAIWSMGLTECKDFPIQFFTKFFENHGLLDLVNRPQWYTIEGGSSSYIEPLTASFKDKIQVDSPVISVKRQKDGVRVSTSFSSELFDEVIFACHADQALRLLDNPTSLELETLSKFKFTNNRVVLHTDSSLLPITRKAWASWNYKIDGEGDLPTLTYNMNILQRLQKKKTYLVTLNQHVDDNYILEEFNYSHPVYSLDGLDAQKNWNRVSGFDKIHYCGAYWLNGFHEDGVTTGIRVAEQLEEL